MGKKKSAPLTKDLQSIKIRPTEYSVIEADKKHGIY